MSLNSAGLNEVGLNEIPQDDILGTVDAFVVRRAYLCVLSAPGFEQVPVPISNISLRQQEGGLSYLTVICSQGAEFSSLISERSEGSFYITAQEQYLDGTVLNADWQSHEITSVIPYQGSTNFSIQITGQTPVLVSSSTPKLTLKDISFISQSASGGTRLRSLPNKDVGVGSVVVYDESNELAVTTLTLFVSVRASSLEVSDG